MIDFLSMHVTVFANPEKTEYLNWVSERWDELKNNNFEDLNNESNRLVTLDYLFFVSKNEKLSPDHMNTLNNYFLEFSKYSLDSLN